MRLGTAHEEEDIPGFHRRMDHQSHTVIAGLDALRHRIPRFVAARHADKPAVVIVHIPQLPSNVNGFAVSPAVLEDVAV